MEKRKRYSELKQASNSSGPASCSHRDSEETLRQSKERHKVIIEGIEEGYIEVDLKGTTIFCNNAFCRITGYTKEELIGMNYQEYTDEETAKGVFEAYNKTYLTRVPKKEFNYEIIRKDGKRRIIENSISIIENFEGHRIGFRSIVRDITDRKRAEDELEKHRSRLRAIFRSVKDAIITIDTEMVVVEANVATESICGLDPKIITGKVFTDCSTQCNKNCHEVFMEALRNKTTTRGYKIECNHIHRPQQTVIVTNSPLLNRNDKFMGSVVVIRDITKLSNFERELKEKHQFHNIIGKSSKMQDIYKLLNELADLETTVLITGESGIGKSLVAKALHYSRKRALKPFVTVNCSALSENLLESELFGHVKGAFTGAIKDTQGRFQTAQDGTILLDEIGDISPRIQLKLLRVLEEREFERVGEAIPLKVNARIIACTNKNLKEKVRRGEFREDLYYRLKVVEVKLPPLRNRLEDIPLLVEHFLNAFNKSFGKSIQGLSDDVLQTFMNYSWPGNVRELENSMEHAFVFCHGPIILLNHLPSEIGDYFGNKKQNRKNRFVEEPEEIRRILDNTDWNKAKAARILGIDRSTLYRKIRQYGLSRTIGKV